MALANLKIEYPELPVVEKREEFIRLLDSHQVVVVKADTGSGKSTQLPKFLLEYFRDKLAKKTSLAEEGATGFKIGVTEPRRLAALSIADRLREELKDETLVSSKIRFWEEGPSDAPLKVMTDGILLQEFRRDRLFKNYSAVMIDEAHERSLNIDILLGIFKTVLTARSEFKLIVASATLDAALFEKFYDNSCVLEAEGRTFPVEVEYRDPYENQGFVVGGSKARGDSGLIEEARDAVLDLMKCHRDHLLCFLPTERDIQDLAGELRKELDDKTYDVLPLFGRMSPEEQRRVFRGSSRTRVVLATNIAETSLTIPGIAYVVDTGYARISRYNAQARIQGLPVEEISKASARQRTGRAGRVKPGVCIRLYSPENFEKREEYTEPEIRRSNLANVVLLLRSLGLSMENFPFLQPPSHSAFRGAYKTLFELGAITAGDASGDITKLGREMCRLPIDVSLSAVLLRARDSGVLQPAIIVCSALSIQDPRVVPSEEPERGRVRGLHRKFGGNKSDFITYLKIWNEFCKEWDGKTWNKLRKFCDKNSFHFLRLREWVDLYEQFSRILDVTFPEKICPIENFHGDNLHIALLSGFLGGVARRDLENGCYRLVSGRETHVFPGSDLYGKSVEWLFSAEVRETSRIFLTKGAEIKPEWILQVAEPFCTKRFFEPTWNKERGFVEALEEVCFRGMVICRGRRVDYARINPRECGEIFFREAVVNMDMARPFAFMEHNYKVVENLHGLEARKRQFGLAPSEDALVDYYVQVAPDVFSIKSLKEFILKNTDKLLKFDEDYWLKRNSTGLSYQSDFKGDKISVGILSKNKASLNKNMAPEHGGAVEQFRVLGRVLVGEMVFDASNKNDGISLKIPYDMLPLLSPSKMALSIGQWRQWMLESVMRELPKSVKKELVHHRVEIDDRFCEKMDLYPHKAPMLLLYEVFSEMKEKMGKSWEGNIPTVISEKENHLRLHLTLFKPGFEEKFPLELSPEWGSYGLFKAVRPVVVSFGIDFALENRYFGWRMGESALMSPEESGFWQQFRKRVEKGYDGGGTRPGIAEGIADRLSMLETGGVHADGFLAPLKIWVAKSLLADGLDVKENVPRFTGLEFSRGRKIKDFRNLASNTRSEDETVRLALVRAAFESGLLGAEAFIKCWNVLREFSLDMRREKSTFLDLSSGVLNKNTPLYRLFALYKNPDSCGVFNLYERLCAVDAVVNGAWIKKVGEDSLEKAEPCAEKNSLAATSLLPEFSAKTLRERFRPYLKSRYLKDHELKAARDILSQVDRAEEDTPEFGDLYLEAMAMLETFDIHRYKRNGDNEEEEVEEGALLKLKGRFGRL
ncbi:MAG: ATP-dependent RNA helicase HrpA [Fibrobacteraceae bacterium]|nr:ATP-dependent RNA helicase HrpA [Fibrobacteraceae bacterium]